MTDHTEMQIPDDVMEAANALADEHYVDKDSVVREIIASAILAERERCARICDSKMYDFGCISGTEAQDFVTLCADLAVEIRSVDK